MAHGMKVQTAPQIKAADKIIECPLRYLEVARLTLLSMTEFHHNLKIHHPPMLTLIVQNLP